MTHIPPALSVPVLLDQSLMIGIPDVDDQHRVLIEEFNRLIGNAQVTPSSEAFGDVMSRLLTELGDHFDFEELLFGQLGLPAEEIDAHVAAHTEILSEYANLHLDLMRHKSMRHADVLSEIRRWIVGHISTYDLKMRPTPERDLAPSW